MEYIKISEYTEWPQFFDLIAAVDSEGGISLNDKLPWRNTPAGREDMSWFKYITLTPQIKDPACTLTAIIMGRKTFDTLAGPLPKRMNIVVTSNADERNASATSPLVIYIKSFAEAIEWAMSRMKHRELSGCVVCGGAEIYKQAFGSPYLRHAYITTINDIFGCDKHFPMHYLKGVAYNIMNYGDNNIKLLNVYIRYDFLNYAEYTYLNLLKELLLAPKKPTRTGVDAYSISHESISVHLYDTSQCCNVLPLLTTKKMFWKSIYYELIWFLRGSTNTQYLVNNGVHIWDANSTRSFLDGRNLTSYNVGELGPIYGYQWRHWGEKYIPEQQRQPNAHPLGCDQLQNVINTIINNPWDRRMVVNSWDASLISDMALPPCHYSFQFNVDPDINGKPKYLNCLVNMRSTDAFCGLPFNIASYALLTHMIAHITKLTPGKLTISMCDVHLYENAREQANIQLMRFPKRFPILKFSDRILGEHNPTIDMFAHIFDIEDYHIIDYIHDPYIKVSMAV